MITHTNSIVKQLAVILSAASNFVLETGISDGGDLQIRIILDISIQDELQFRLRYTKIRTNEQRDQTVDGNFINQQSIFFRVPLAQLPFSGSQSTFTVQVAMEVNSVLGNFTKPSKLLSKKILLYYRKHTSKSSHKLFLEVPDCKCA